MNAPRVAFFTDTFHEINGVALTSRQFTEFARRHERPFLCIRGSTVTSTTQESSVTFAQLRRGPLSFALDRGLYLDPALWRLKNHVTSLVEQFRPDIVHVVSPGDVSTLGVWIARQLKLPIAISWHTNLHEFAAVRFGKHVRWLSNSLHRSATSAVEKWTLDACIAYYRLGAVLYAPNAELIEMLRARTGKPVFPMRRGIDTVLFNPARRTVDDSVLRLGYVGRVTPEKSVRFLRELESGLHARGVPPFRFLIIGDGSERPWLREHLADADLPGVHRGEDLARDYANMDVFVFPSRTDTFGNVVLEAMASGVPAVVTDAGGPKFIVNHGVSGFVAGSNREFIEHTAKLLCDNALRAKMSESARCQACGESWDDVFTQVYKGYESVIRA